MRNVSKLLCIIENISYNGSVLGRQPVENAYKE